MNDVLFMSKSDEWSTPEAIFNDLNREFGFNLDPCATEENHKCDNFYTIDDNGLLKNWGGGEFFVILHIQKFTNGLKKHITRVLKKILSSFYSFRQERIRDIFTIISIIDRKFDLFAVASSSEREKIALLFRV